MSRTKNQELSSWKVVLTRLRRTETSWRGIPLSRLDHETYTEAILYTAMVLHDLSNRYEGLGTKRDHVMWAQNCVHIDVDQLAHFLPDAIRLFRSDTTDGTAYTSYADFKRQLSKAYPFAGTFLGPVGRAIDLHVSQPTPATFYPVYQFLSFMTHLTLVDLDMGSQLEDEYIANENRLATLHLPDHLLVQMNSIMKDWLHDFSIGDEFLPKHGPGAVAELSGDTSLREKYGLLQPDFLIEYVFRKYSGLEASTFVPQRREGNTSRQAAVVFVPKSMKTKRVISKEPATLMYFQQGVDRNLRKYIATHKVLSAHLDLTHQEKQRDLALKASRTKEYATVDLSAASDSISYELVKRVFRGTPLYPYLVALRSRTAVLPSGKVQSLAKFAPMGSALSFPIESLIFACVAECALRYARYEGLTSQYDFHVYGDDIIIPDRCLYDLEIFLLWCGFRINRDKTYGGNYRFRESCGCDAYDGTEVTCLKIGRRFSSRQVSSRSPGVFEGLVDMANQAYVFKFQLLRRFIVDKLVNDTGYIPLFSEDVSRGVYSPQPSNHRVPHRNNDDLQYEEVKVAGSRTVQALNGSVIWNQKRRAMVLADPPVDDETVRYFEWLRATSDRSGDPFDPTHLTISHIGNAGCYLSKSWTYLDH